MRAKTLLLFVLACFIAAPLLQAQEQGQQQSGPPSATGSQTASTDAQGLKRYLLGPGDTLDIRVYGQPDLSGPADVDADGNIELPFVDKPIRARCRTEQEVSKEIVAAYSKFIKNPQVSVRTTGRNSRAPAIVYGAVRAPQRLQMLRRVRLNEIIAVSGGITERASGNIQVTHTEEVMCPEPGETVEPLVTSTGDLKMPFKVYKINELAAGKEEANPWIRPGDVVTVLEAEPVYITGSVVNPQGIYLRDQMTVTRALFMVGGIKKEGKESDVVIYRQKPGSSETEQIRVDVAAIKKKKQPDVLLKPYDVIEVKEEGAFTGKNILRMLTNSVLGIGPSMIGSFGTTLPMRVLY
jgi:polysaccharide export outer membrane protein